MKRVAIIFDRLGPYHLARLRAASKLLDITAIELHREDSVYAWDVLDNGSGADGFQRVTLSDGDGSDVRQILDRIDKSLSGCDPQAVAIHGWYEPTAMRSLLWCLRNQVPAIVMSESTAWDGKRRPHVEWVKSRVLQCFSAALVGGQSSRQYISQLGMSVDHCFQGYDAIDNDHFSSHLEEMRANRKQVAAELNLPEKYFLASGRFVEKKNFPGLLMSYAAYRKQVADKNGEPWSLVILGDGGERPAIEAAIREWQLEGHVQLAGFQQYDCLPKYYALASAFVHASAVEQWGLVVNEAMAAGLPVIVSNRCGCARDLVLDDQNGWQFDPDDGDTLSDLMMKMSSSSLDVLSSMGARSREIVAEWGPDRFASGLSNAVESAASQPVAGRGLMRHLDEWLVQMRARP